MNFFFKNVECHCQSWMLTVSHWLQNGMYLSSCRRAKCIVFFKTTVPSPTLSLKTAEMIVKFVLSLKESYAIPWTCPPICHQCNFTVISQHGLNLAFLFSSGHLPAHLTHTTNRLMFHKILITASACWATVSYTWRMAFKSCSCSRDIHWRFRESW